jgi:hypothetical protein
MLFGVCKARVPRFRSCDCPAPRVRYIEQAFERIRQVKSELKFSCLTLAYFHVPRLRHLLWSGYVREARDALAEIRYFIPKYHLRAQKYHLRAHMRDQCENEMVSATHRRVGSLSQIERDSDDRLLSALLAGRPISCPGRNEWLIFWSMRV